MTNEYRFLLQEKHRLGDEAKGQNKVLSHLHLILFPEIPTSYLPVIPIVHYTDIILHVRIAFLINEGLADRTVVKDCAYPYFCRLVKLCAI